MMSYLTVGRELSGDLAVLRLLRVLALGALVLGLLAMHTLGHPSGHHTSHGAGETAGYLPGQPAGHSTDHPGGRAVAVGGHTVVAGQGIGGDAVQPAGVVLGVPPLVPVVLPAVVSAMLPTPSGDLGLVMICLAILGVIGLAALFAGLLTCRGTGAADPGTLSVSALVLTLSALPRAPSLSMLSVLRI